MVAEYDYLGVDRVVRTDLPEPDYYKTLSDASNCDRLDRFGRVIEDVWTRPSSVVCTNWCGCIRGAATA